MEVTIAIGARLQFSTTGLEPELVTQIKEAFEHRNPQWEKLRRMGYPAYGEPRKYVLWAESDGTMTLPRGGLAKLLKLLDDDDHQGLMVDQTTLGMKLGPKLPVHNVKLRDYQEEMLQSASVAENGLVLAGTGAGKTTAFLALASKLGCATLVMVWNGALFEQWIKRAQVEMGMRRQDIGEIRGGKFRLRTLTIAMQQSLHVVLERGDEQADTVKRSFGALLVDEVQRAAAKTFVQCIDPFPARYRLGTSADHCVVKGTSVLMGDGSNVPIETIRVGDIVETPLGPRRVSGAYNTGCLRTVKVKRGLSHVRCTPNTRFMTEDGWAYPETLCYAFVYEEHGNRLRRTVRGLRQGEEATLQDPLSHEVQAGGDLHHGGRGLPGVRREVRDQQGDDRTRRTDSSACLDSMGEGKDQRDRPSAYEDREGPGRAEERQTSEGGSRVCSPESQHAGGSREDGGGGSQGIRGGSQERLASSLRQRSVDPEGRGSSDGADDGVRLQARTRGADARGGVAESLQTRLRSRGQESWSRDRWGDSRYAEGQGGGREEGSSASEEGLEGHQVQVNDLVARSAAETCSLEEVLVEDDGLMVETFDLEVEDAHCFFANGFLVHNTRKDRREFLTNDLFGEVVCEIGRDRLIDEGHVLDVEVRVVPTQFECVADDYNEMIGAMVLDEKRNAIVEHVMKSEVENGHQVVALTQRVDHAVSLDVRATALGIRCGAMLGGPHEERRYAATLAGLRDGSLRAATATIQAFGTGIDVPSLGVGIVATPLAGNRQLFAQVRGRLCRTGKAEARIYYLYDHRVFGWSHLRNLVKWNRRVVVNVKGEWVDGKRFLSDKLA